MTLEIQIWSVDMLQTRPLSSSQLLSAPHLGGLPLREDDKCRPVNIERRVHRRRALLPAGEGEAHVRAVPHAVGGKGLEDSRRNLLVGMRVLEVQGPGAPEEALQVPVQLEDLTAVNADALPDRVAALHGGVEGRDGVLVAGVQRPCLVAVGVG